MSEGGLHTITLRSHAAITPGTTAHRFRKWVTSEVLPSIRKTGAFGVSREAPEGLIAMNEQRLALDMVSEARRLYGPARGRLLWETLGLPHVPPLAEVFDASGHDCLAFLLKHETHNGSLHELVLAALRSGDDAALRPFGLRIEPEFNGLLVASSFRALAKIFAASDWRNGAWTRALRSLPGSVPWKVTKFTRADPVSKCTFVRAEHAEGPARASA